MDELVLCCGSLFSTAFQHHIKMNDKIKLIGKFEGYEVKFSIDPNTTMDEMMKYLEAFLKGIGYQFGNLNWTLEDE
jgi:hypothetical protein